MAKSWPWFASSLFAFFIHFFHHPPHFSTRVVGLGQERSVYRRENTIGVVLTRNLVDNMFAVAMFDNEPSTRTAIKAFFVQEGIEPLLGHSGQVPIGASSLVYPLPLNASRATDLATGLLRTAYQLSDDAGLDFRYYEMDTPV